MDVLQKQKKTKYSWLNLNHRAMSRKNNFEASSCTQQNLCFCEILFCASDEMVEKERKSAKVYVKTQNYYSEQFHCIGDAI